CSEDDAFADIAQKTKRLARKQMGWFGRDSRIHWVNALQPDVVDASMKIINAADNGDFKDDLIAESTSHHLGALIVE
ncbi:tRNA (adenosine(37)-N6)-dimethylallyltransferase MiaA, partial [Gardnerella vaginalis]